MLISNERLRSKFLLAREGFWCYSAVMPNSSTKPKKSTPPKPGDLNSDLMRAKKFSENRHRDMATRSTLSRLRNRKSALK